MLKILGTNCQEKSNDSSSNQLVETLCQFHPKDQRFLDSENPSELWHSLCQGLSACQGRTSVIETTVEEADLRGPPSPPPPTTLSSASCIHNQVEQSFTLAAPESAG